MTYCPHCMRPAEGAYCAYCGGPVNWRAAEGQLPVGSLLQGAGGHTYQIGAARGQGGFGITYIAMDLDTKQRVAVKEYFPTRCAHRTHLNKVEAVSGQSETYQGGMHSFLEEARMLAAVGALPSVVTVYDYFEANGSAYLVMEYLEGIALYQMVKQQGKIPASQLMPKLPALLRDLGKLHQAGVIHRDISPDNLMWMPDGTLKLLDFGSARSVQDGKSMTVLLKAGFSPVEQYQTRGQGPWTDVYALAGTIYYCLTGVIPPSALDRLDVDELQPPRALGADLTREQEAALLWGLTVQPKSRPATMEAFAQRLFPEKTRSAPKPGPTPGPVPGPAQKPKPALAGKKKGLMIGGIAAAAVIVVCVLAAALSGDNSGMIDYPGHSSRPSYSAAPAPTPKPTSGVTDDGYHYTVANGEATLTGYSGEEASVLAIPDEIDGVRITGIGAGAFQGLSELKSVVLPLYLERVGENAFADCTNLRDVYIYSEVEADSTALSGCTRLRCLVRVVEGISLGGWMEAMPSDDFEIYTVSEETGVGKLSYMEVDDDGVVYGIATNSADEKVGVVMDIPTGLASVTVPENVLGYPVVWINKHALQEADGMLTVHLAEETIFPFEIFSLAMWVAESGTFADNWVYSCVGAQWVNNNRSDGEPAMEPTEELVRAAMVRAEELAESYGSERPNGGSSYDILKELDISYSTAWTWRSRTVSTSLDKDERAETLGGKYAPEDDGKYYTEFGMAFSYTEEYAYAAAYGIVPK